MRVIWKLKDTKKESYTEINKSIFTIGRNEQADLTLTGGSVSRKHCEFYLLSDGSLCVLDLGSSNGTFVNKLKLLPKVMHKLTEGDIIGVGGCLSLCANDELKNALTFFELIRQTEDDDDVIEIPDSQSTPPLADIIDDVRISNSENVTTESCNTNASRSNDMVMSTVTNILENKTSAVPEPELKIPEMQVPLGVNSVIKNEAETSKNASYTGLDSCIVVISDDEDDDRPPCSQLFSLAAKVKTEDEDYDAFVKIKQELVELDNCDDNLLNKVPIDIDDVFNDTDDLLGCLESPSKSGEYSNDLDTHSVVEATIPKLGSRESLHSENVEKDQKKEVISKKGKEKYCVPPVIAPHVMYGKRKITEKSERTIAEKVPKKNISPLKRKSSYVPEAKPGTSRDSKELKDKKEMIRNERKHKLKEIEDQKQRNKETNKAQDKIKTQPKVKVSENRGLFLVDQKAPAPKPRTKQTEAKTTKSVNKHRRRSSNTVPEPLHQEPTGNLPSKNSTNNDILQDNTITSNTSPNQSFGIANPIPVKHQLTVQPVKYSHGVSTVMNCFKIPTRTPSPNVMREKIDEMVCKVISWPYKWLEEQTYMETSPPVNDVPARKMMMRFGSFQEYYDNVKPLIMLEVWQDIYSTTYKETSAVVRSEVVHTRNVEGLVYIDCECYVTKKQIEVIKTKDLALVELKMTDTKSMDMYQFTGFAFVFNLRCDLINDNTMIKSSLGRLCNGIPYAYLKYTLVMKKQPNKEIPTKSSFYVRSLANLGGYTKLMNTLKLLQGSPLCRKVLKPDINDFNVVLKVKNLQMDPNLNGEQKMVVQEAFNFCMNSSSGMYYIQGPPGTGKSTTIVNLVMQILLSENNTAPRLLLTAPSNAAIDTLILKIVEAKRKLQDPQRAKIKLIRTGIESSINEQVRGYSLHYLTLKHLLGAYQSSGFDTNGLIPKEEEKFLMGKLGPKYSYEYRMKQDIVFSKSNIICTTLTSCVSYRMMEYCRRGYLNINCCIIDEAAQCNEIQTLLPINLGVTKFILIGDPMQLQATVCNREAQALGFGQSLFERIHKNFEDQPNSPIRILKRQYRMHEEICHFPNRQFYKNILQSSPTHANKICPRLKPYLVINLKENTKDNNDSEYINTSEINIIKSILSTLHSNVSSKCWYTVGIITPYKAQKFKILESITDIRFNYRITINVNTVDSFQGSENDVVIISCVRNSPNNFLSNPNRLNVAITRARQALYIIGNDGLFNHCPHLYDLREDAKRRKLCLDFKDNPNNLYSLKNYIFT